MTTNPIAMLLLGLFIGALVMVVFFAALEVGARADEARHPKEPRQ